MCLRRPKRTHMASRKTSCIPSALFLFQGLVLQGACPASSTTIQSLGWVHSEYINHVSKWKPKLQLQSLPIGYALLTHFTPIVFSCGSLWNLLDTRVFQSARLKPVPDASNALSIQVPHFSNTTTAVKHAYWQCTQPPHNRLAYTG